MYIASTNAKDVVSAVTAMERSPDDALMLFVGDEDRPDLGDLVSALNSAGVTFFGGVFPGLVSGTARLDSGVVAVPVPLMSAPYVVQDLDTEDFSIPAFPELADLPAGAEPTAFVLVDGLTSNIVAFLQEMFQHLGTSVHYVGGGAGSLSLEQKPVLFTPEGVFQDAAIVAFSPLKSGLGVRHGWTRLVGPVVATQTEKNVIRELNWQSAFDVYREVVESDSGRSFDGGHFMDIAKSYPLGMQREGVEDVVRDPLSTTEDGSIVSVGEVPENSVMYVLKGGADDLPVAAAQAAEDSVRTVDGDVRCWLVVDCISRALFLGDDIQKELAAVLSRLPGSAPELCGVFSLGEISSYGDGLLEFFNKTIVVGALHE